MSDDLDEQTLLIETLKRLTEKKKRADALNQTLFLQLKQKRIDSLMVNFSMKYQIILQVVLSRLLISNKK